jgi:tetratricopeptide (TPR) repeat protein
VTTDSEAGGMDDETLDEVVAFISYAREDGAGHLENLHQRLSRMPFRVQAWSDREIGSASAFTRTIERQLRGCDVVLFIMTPASVIDSEWCLRELLAADQARKIIEPLEFHSGLELERSLTILERSSIRLLPGDDDAGWAELEQRLHWHASPRRRLRTLRAEQEDLRTRMAATTDEMVRQRLDRRLTQVTRQVEEFESRSGDTERATREQQERIEAGWLSEQNAERAPAVRAGSASVFGKPPDAPAEYFTDREDEVAELVRQVNEPGARLIVLHGGEGIGKTAILHRVWQRFVSGDAGAEPISLDYLSAVGVEPLTAGTVVRALERQVADRDAAPGSPTWPAGSSWSDRASDVLDALGGRRVLLALDAVEELLDEGLEFSDGDLADVVDVIISRSGHQVRLLLTSRHIPQPLLDRIGGRFSLVPRTGGLPYARVADMLAALDRDQAIGWSDVPEPLLRRLRDLIDGSPRAIELCHGILVADPEETPAGLVDLLERRRLEGYGEVLLGRVFDLLEHDERLVVQAMAVLRKAVPAAAVEHVLQDQKPGLDSRPFLKTLCEQRLIRREIGGRYLLPAAPDGDYALATLRRGTRRDRERTPAPLTQLGLLHRAADYWARTRPVHPVTSVDQLRVQFNEIDTRIRGEEYERALRLMAEMDENHLVGWGHSGALIPAFKGLLAAPDLPGRARAEAVLLLVRALFYQEKFDSAVTELERALRDLPRWGAPIMRVRLEIQSAFALAQIGRLPEADRGYRAVARRAMFVAPLLAANAQAGRAWCLARQGRFDRALGSARTARNLLRIPHSGDLEWLRAKILEAEGWVYGRLGDRDRARRRFARGLECARRSGDRQAEAKLLCAQAELAIEGGEPGSALSFAEEAARLGAGMSGRAVLRDAQETIALARLCLGQVQAAAAAAAIATRHRPTAAGLVMAGLIAYRRDHDGDRDAALAAFNRAHVLAGSERARNDRGFNPAYVDALALVGMTLCGARDQEAAAVAAFAAGRRIAAASGIVERNVLLLRLFDVEGTGSVVRFTNAARGS